MPLKLRTSMNSLRRSDTRWSGLPWCGGSHSAAASSANRVGWRGWGQWEKFPHQVATHVQVLESVETREYLTRAESESFLKPNGLAV
jgi:hypothetical protein